MNEQELLETVKVWEANGFALIGNGTESNEDDPNTCPKCGREYIFWSIFEHPTKTRHIETDSEYNPLLCNAVYHCLDCDHYWTDEDEIPSEVSKPD